MRVALISCVKSKKAEPARVVDFYTSALFKSSMAYASRHADKWYVLSAKHGLLSPGQVVAPYDETLKTMSRAEQRAWAERVQRQLSKAIPRGADVLVMAGVAYRRHLIPFLKARGHEVAVPLEGKRLGEQLRELAHVESPLTGKTASRDLDRFYRALARLAGLPGQGTALGECNGRMPWPERGVYFFVEPGELRCNGRDLRVVRVGTHAVSEGSGSTLWGRLRAHRGTASGDGNHRGSVFRRHVGHALIARKLSLGDIPASWGIGSSSEKRTRLREVAMEKQVSAYLARTRVFWVEIADGAGRHSQRSYIERNAIALLSNKLNPVDSPSARWLGRSSDREAIRKSGLWNVDYVDHDYDPGFVAVFEKLVREMTSA